MGIRVKQLKFIADDITRNQKLLEGLREEVRGTLGCLISISDGLDDACYQVNNVLDVAQARGKTQEVSVKTALLKKLLETKSQEARRLATRLLPANLIINLRFDHDPVVRLEACKRLPRRLVAEVVENFPSDYEVQYIMEKKGSHDDEHLHIHNDKRLGASARPSFQPELSDTWYRDRAERFLNEYGDNIEFQWEETIVRRYCSSVRATSGIDLDAKKLYDALMKLIEEREEEALLKDERKKLKKLEKIRESRELNVSQNDDFNLTLNERQSPHQFVKNFNEKFNVMESDIPTSLRKHVLGGGTFKIPAKANIPGKKLTPVLERAFDAYVKNWNEIQSLKGDPITLSWDVDPLNESRVCFSAILR